MKQSFFLFCYNYLYSCFFKLFLPLVINSVFRDKIVYFIKGSKLGKTDSSDFCMLAYIYFFTGIFHHTFFHGTFLLVAVKPEYQSKGVFAMMFNDLLGNYIEMGIQNIESNPELEDNKKILAQWENFDKEQHKRRRAFKKEI